MRVALISDLHGNAAALDAVLASARQERVDQLVCLGDVATLGPRPAELIDTLMQLACPCILGNHDEFLLQPELIAAYTSAPLVVQSVAWCGRQLADRHLQFLASMKREIALELAEGVRIACFHGSPRSNTDNVLPAMSDEALDGVLGEVQAEVIAIGHTHLQMVRQHRGRLVVNPGSVGMPFKEYAGGGQPTVLPHAEYAIVHADAGRISITVHRIELDLQLLRDQLRGSALPLRDSLLAQYGG